MKNNPYSSVTEPASHKWFDEKDISKENMKNNIKPRAGRVVVLPDPAPEKTQSGLFLPDSGKIPPSSGIITHVSDTEAELKVGDHVLFVKNAGVELGMAPVHFLMREEDIYATI